MHSQRILVPTTSDRASQSGSNPLALAVNVRRKCKDTPPPSQWAATRLRTRTRLCLERRGRGQDGRQASRLSFEEAWGSIEKVMHGPLRQMRRDQDAKGTHPKTRGGGVQTVIYQSAKEKSQFQSQPRGKTERHREGV